MVAVADILVAEVDSKEVVVADSMEVVVAVDHIEEAGHRAFQAEV